MSDGIDSSKVERIRRGMSLANPEDASYFGAGEQRKAARMAHGLLSASQSADLGVGEALDQALAALRSMSLSKLDPGKKPFAARIPLIGDLFDPAEEILASHESAALAVSRAELDLEGKARDLARSVASLRSMREENRELLSDLSHLIEAGKSKLSEIEGKGPRGSAAEMIERSLERRLHNLELSRLMAMQFDPQIEMMERSAREMGEKIQSSILLALPLWRQQMAIGLELFRQARLAESKARIESALAKELESNANGMRALAANPQGAGAARESLERAQRDLLGAINGVLDERDRARAARASEMAKIESMSGEIEQGQKD